MSAEVLREAARLMRERAEKATGGIWSHSHQGLQGGEVVHSGDLRIARVYKNGWPHYLPDCENAAHIASWHPAVALAVAKAMDDVAQAWEISDGWTRDLDDDPIRFEDTVDGGWLRVARAYLGASA